MNRLVILLLISFSCSLLAQNPKATRTNYINKFGKTAVSEMKRSGIPSSITLAQGMIESSNGNSSLAVEGKNHFGIKCHNDWKGERMYYDDDAKGECFRKYKSNEESFKDHTDFLLKTKRYAPLFEIDAADYKAWAKGLKKYGYATHPDYANMLIKIIEEERLYEFDKGVVVTREVPIEVSTSRRAQKVQPTLFDEFKIHIGRQILSRNRIDYIIAKASDSFDKINKELDLLSFELRKYNDLPQDYTIKEGDILYLQPKRRSAEVGFGYHQVKEGETMQSISQEYGIRLKRLYRLNQMEQGTEPIVGQKISLRKKIKKESSI